MKAFYFYDGWKQKMTSRNKGKLTITIDNGKTWFQIDTNDPRLNTLSYKTASQLKPTYKGKKYIHKDNLIKRVKPDEIQIYLDNGWKLGMKNK